MHGSDADVQEQLQELIDCGLYYEATRTNVSIIYLVHGTTNEDIVNGDSKRQGNILVYSTVDKKFYGAESWASAYFISLATDVMLKQQEDEDDDGVDYSGLDMDDD